MKQLEERIKSIEKTNQEIKDRLTSILEHIEKIEQVILPNKCSIFKSSNTELICDNCGKPQYLHH